ncbi:hypothetical protein CFC21_090747 [Triticum aestivum]|uniref:GCK domain-containing protein n=3 Tax=Triticinae TaxID=1648030 RepID=A0A453MPB3_AEGTS|nr:hypothetical protein CFC21_090747 [Triticum aestivum]
MGNYMSNQLSYRHTQRVVVKMDMEKGGCGTEFHWARTNCEGRKNAADVQRCIKSTAALQECMEGNKCHFNNYIKIMNKGLDEDEQRHGSSSRYLLFWEQQDRRWRWRWWTGMIRTSPPPASDNPFAAPSTR